ncbi:hypothetical protein AS593_15035 [Caulobacter vibrioides]|nr:hypothetical protein AS593_15035 [Caulobacter vibrioides]
MYVTRFLSAAAAMALLSGVAIAQTADPAAPAQPPAAAPPAATAAPATPAAKVTPNGDLIATAQASGQFTTFLKALDATNLTSVLKSNPNLTVFAPTDAAFAALPAGELDRLMQPANAAQLQKVLTYHVINTKVDSTKITGAKGEVKTVEGSSVTLDGSGASPMVDGANIVQADVMATNGVLHVVDKVLIPKDVPIQAAAAAATDDAATSMASATINGDAMSATDAGADVSAQAAPAAAPAPDQATTPSATDAPADQALNPTTSPAAAPADPTAATTAPAAETGTAAPTSATLPASSMSPDQQATLKAGDANVVSNPPVADTPENRKAYGAPMSNAGKRSSAKGN